MAKPSITIDIKKIKLNTNSIAALCKMNGIQVTGVTKVTCGMPEVAGAMLAGGASAIGESRLENIRKMKENGIDASFLLLRIPHLSAVDEVVELADISLNSDLNVIKGLSQAAVKQGKVHEIILMIDLGDLREGIWPDDLFDIAGEILKLPGIKFAGIGTNLTCYGGVIPTEKNLGQLVEYAEKLEAEFCIELKYISGGNSSSLPLLAAGKMPERINHLRIGEAILLGRETVNREKWPGTDQDAFIFSAEIIELKEKPSVPIGEIGQDAFGGTPVFENKGNIKRGILNIGRQDVDIDGIEPVDKGIRILGGSSDHLLVDVTESALQLETGKELRFYPGYGALLALMTSAYVEKKIINN